MAIDEKLLLECFPFESPRDSQLEAIFEILEARENGYEHVILEGPTGSGKSGIAYTVNKYVSIKEAEDDAKTCITTISKYLQNQYKRDFKDLANIVSSSDPIYTCDESHTRGTEGCLLNMKETRKSCLGQCPYRIAARNFLKGPISLTNTHFIARLFRSFSVLTFDECHEIGNVVTSTAEFEAFEPDEVLMSLIFGLEEYLPAIEAWKETLVVLKDVKHGEVIRTPINDRLKDIDLINAAKRVEELAGTSGFRSLRGHLNKFTQAVNACILTEGKEIIKIRPTKDDPHIMKPVYAADFADQILFSKGDFLLHMSATVCGDRAYSRELGFENHKWKSITIKHPIPVENRLFKFSPVSWMSAKSEERDIERTVEAVDKLIKRYDSNTILHTASYRRAEKIKELSGHNIEVPRSAKDAVDYLTGNIGKAYVASPSLVAGVDGKDDLCRLNIICKVPFPSFGDPVVKYVSKNRPELISLQVVRSIVQAAGRGTRHEEDYSHTYMLDGMFDRVYAQNTMMFPEWFKESIEWNNK